MDTHKKPRKVGLNYGDHKGSHLLSTFRATHGSNPARAGTNISVPLDLDSSPDPLIAQGVSEGLREMRSPTPGGAGTRGQIGGRRKAGGASGVSNVSDTTGAGVAKKVPATPSRVSARLRAASKEPVVYSGDEENGDEDGPIGGEDEEKENKGKKKQGGVVKKGSAVKSGKAAAIRVTATTTTTTTRRSTRSKKKPPIEEGKEDEDMSKKQKKTTPEVVSSDDEDVRGWELKPTSWRRTTTYKKRGVFSSSQPRSSQGSTTITTAKGKRKPKETSVEDEIAGYVDPMSKYTLPQEELPGFINPMDRHKMPSPAPLETPARPSPKKSRTVKETYNNEFESPVFQNPKLIYGAYGNDSPDELESARHCLNSEPESQLPEILDAQLPVSQPLTDLELSDLDSDFLRSSSPSNSRKRKTSPLSPPPADLDLSPETSFSHDPNACTICGETLAQGFLDLHFSSSTSTTSLPFPPKRLKMKLQLELCKKHKTFSANQLCLQKKYPALDINWRLLPRRIEKQIPTLRKILTLEKGSLYRDELYSSENTTSHTTTTHTRRRWPGVGGGRNLLSSDFGSHSPGYYGPRGALIIMEVLMSRMGNLIRKVGVNDKVIAAGGVSGYVQSVLVPECAVRLVMEDMGLGEEEARKVVGVTGEVGELLNDEVEGDEGEEKEDEDEEEDEEEEERIIGGESSEEEYGGGTTGKKKNVWLKV